MEKEKEHLKQLMSGAQTIDEQFEYLTKIQELEKLINKEKK